MKSHLRALFEAFALDPSQTRHKRAELIDRAVRMGAVGARDLTSTP